MRPLGLVATAAAVIGLAGSRSFDPAPGRLSVDGPTTINVGPRPPGTFGRQPWTLRNAGPAPVRLRTYFTSGRCGFSLWQRATHVVDPGGSIAVWLAYPVPSAPGRAFSSHVLLRSDDPGRPEVRLRVYGISAP